MTFDLGIDFDKVDLALPPAREVTVLRELTPADYAAVGTSPTGGSQDYQPKRITERHHALARALALGMKDHEAATRVGYHPQMLFILKKSPAFMELVEIYRAEVNMAFADHAEMIAGLSTDAILELRSRLEDDPAAFSSKFLLEIVTMMGDRAGFGPIKRTENVNVNVSLGEKLAAARRRVSQMRDVTPND